MYDIFHFLKNAGFEIGTEAFGRHELDLTAKEVFEKKGKVHEIPEVLFAVSELDEQIDIALLGLLPLDKGTKEADRLDAQPLDLVSAGQ